MRKRMAVRSAAAVMEKYTSMCKERVGLRVGFRVSRFRVQRVLSRVRFCLCLCAGVRGIRYTCDSFLCVRGRAGFGLTIPHLGTVLVRRIYTWT